MSILWATVHEFHIIKTQSVNTLVNGELIFILQTGVLLIFKSIGSLNIECSIFFPWFNFDAISDDMPHLEKFYQMNGVLLTAN